MSILPCACSGVPSSVATLGSWAPTVTALSAYGQTIPHAPGVLAQVSGGSGRTYPLMEPVTSLSATKVQYFSPAVWRPYDVVTVTGYAPSQMVAVNPHRAQSGLVHGHGDMFAHHPSRYRQARDVAEAAVASDASLAQLAATAAATEPFAAVDGIAQLAPAPVPLVPSGGGGGGPDIGGFGGGGYGGGGYAPGYGQQIDQVGPLYYANGCGCCRNPSTPLDPSGYAAWKHVIEAANLPYQQFAPDCLAGAASRRVFGLFDRF